MEWQWKRDCRETLELPPGNEPEPPGIVLRGSHCPKCGFALKPWHNIPLLSWLALRGRCAGCGTAISLQYPLVELLTGLAFAAVVWQLGVGAPALAGLVFTALLIAMSGIDARTTLLPDSLTLPLLWIGLLASTQNLFLGMDQAIYGAVVGYLALWTVYWGFKLLTGKEGMGYGDFKLLAALGAWCGLSGILPIVLMSAVVGAVFGSVWLAIKGRDRATPIPYGPYLAAAGWIQFLWGEQILGAYLRYSGLAH
nr:A24 family peptidase [Aquimonas voraii]